MIRGSWSGNVRELDHVIASLVYSCQNDDTIRVSMVESKIPVSCDEAEFDFTLKSDLNLRHHTDRLEIALINAALHQAGGNKTKAAELLGITRNGLDSKLRRLGLVADFRLTRN
jgi:DNA-binding NtrC family response regulator